MCSFDRAVARGFIILDRSDKRRDFAFGSERSNANISDLESQWHAENDPEAIIDYLVFATDPNCLNQDPCWKILHIGIGYQFLDGKLKTKKLLDRLLNQAAEVPQSQELDLFVKRVRWAIDHPKETGLMTWFTFGGDRSGEMYDVTGVRNPPPSGTSRDPEDARERFESRFGRFRWQDAISHYAKHGLISVPALEVPSDVSGYIDIEKVLSDFLERNEINTLFYVDLEVDDQDKQFPADGDEAKHYARMVADAWEHWGCMTVGAIFPKMMHLIVTCTFEEYFLVTGSREVLQDFFQGEVEVQIEKFRQSIFGFYDATSVNNHERAMFASFMNLHGEALAAVNKIGEFRQL